MRIALCLSGGLRNFKDTYHTFKHFLLDKHDVDLFFYGLENKEGKTQNQKDLISIYNARSFQVNDELQYSEIECKYPIKSSYYSFYNVMKCNDLKIAYEKENNFKYDLVIRSRTDYFWFRELSQFELLTSKNKIILPQEWSFKCVNPIALTDAFAVGSSELMDQYSLLFNNIDRYCLNVPFHPETLCGWHLNTNNIPYHEHQRCVIFEYPSKRIEKYITPYKFIRYFDDDMDISEETDYLLSRSNKRKNF